MPQNSWDQYLIPAPSTNKWDQYAVQPEPEQKKGLWSWLNEPVTQAGSFINNIMMAPQAAMMSSLLGQDRTDKVRQFGNQVTDSMTSPMNLGMTALTGGTLGAAKAGLTGLASGLNTATRVASAPYAATGAYNVYNEPTAAGKFMGGVEALGGILGAKYGVLPETPRAVPVPETNPARLLPAIGETTGPSNAHRFSVDPSGRVGDLTIPDTREGLNSLRVTRPGTADIIDAQRAADDMYNPGARANIDAPVPNNWDWSKFEVSQAPDPLSYRTYESPGVAGIGNASTNKPTFGEFTRRDYLSEKGNIFSTVPDRLRPEPTNVGLFKGDAARVTPEKKLAFTPKTVTIGEGLTSVENTPLASLSDELLPSAPPKGPISRFRLENPVVKAEIPNVAKATNVAEDVLTEGLKSANPEVQGVIRSFINKVRDLGNSAFSTAGTRLKQMGPDGYELYRRSNRYTHQERFNLKEWVEPYKNAGMKLSKDERAKFARYAQGTEPIPNPAVQEAVDLWHKAQNAAGETAENLEMLIDKDTPFKRIPGNYFPHRAKDPKTLPSKITELMKDTIDKDGTVHKGMSRAEAEQVIARARQFGEIIIPAQHKRLNRIFDYDESFDAGLAHLESMAKATARTKEFGRMDVTGKGLDGIADIIEKTSDPEYAMKVMKRVIGREEKLDERLDSLVRGARTAVSWARLQNYGLSSIIGNQLPNMLRATGKEYVRSLGAFIGKNRAITDKSAAAMDISHGIMEHTKRYSPMTVYGGTAAENIVRAQAAGIGEGMARTAFRELKLDPNNAAMKQQLFELILENPDEVLKQASLTDDQIRMAAARNAEISQGITAPMNLPMWASKPVTGPGDAALQTALIFKKQAAIQTKMLKDAFKMNPVKTTALMLGFSQIAGGTIGTIKSVIRGAVSGTLSGEGTIEGIKRDLDTRADYLGRYTGTDNKLINGTLDRMLQSWALGLGSDLLFLALDKNAWSEFAGGPVVGLAGDIVGNITNPTQLGRETMKMLPIPGGVGQGIQRGLLPTESQR